MDVLTILNGYYNAFINLDNTRDFFIGLADYIDFVNTVPEFERVGDEIRNEKKPLEKRLKASEAALLKKMSAIKKESESYVAANNILDQEIESSFKMYESWLDKTTVGSMSPAVGASGRLFEVILHLHNIPEHRQFSTKYLKTNTDGAIIFDRLHVVELAELQEAEHEQEVGQNTTRWGQLENLSRLYGAIKRGREEYKKLVEAHKKTKTTVNMWAVMNLSFLVGEWVMIEEGNSPRQTYFFDIRKVKPWVIRLHNYVAAQYKINFEKTQMLGLAKTNKGPIKPKSIKIKSARLENRLLIINEGQEIISFNANKADEKADATKTFKVFKILWVDHFERKDGDLTNRNGIMITAKNLMRIGEILTLSALRKLVARLNSRFAAKGLKMKITGKGAKYKLTVDTE